MDGNQHIRSVPDPPHGFADDARGCCLRRRPPPEALAWVERVLGSPVSVVRAYRGGSSSALHGLRVAGSAHTVVLRRYVLEDLNLEEPDIAEREAHVLRLLGRCPVTTPALLGVDPTGEGAGVPAVLMRRVPGRLDWSPNDLDAWLHKLVDVLPSLHNTSVQAADGVQEFRPYRPESWDPPEWLRDHKLWDRALAVFYGPRLDHERFFIHRDYHPGNVLWRRGRVSGVVDWQAAGVGPRAADVWHCRGNLIGRFGMEVADRFLELWQAVTGLGYHPWTEAVMLVDAIGWRRPRRPAEQHALEDLLARRLSELGA